MTDLFLRCLATAGCAVVIVLAAVLRADDEDLRADDEED